MANRHYRRSAVENRQAVRVVAVPTRVDFEACDSGASSIALSAVERTLLSVAMNVPVRAWLTAIVAAGTSCFGSLDLHAAANPTEPYKYNWSSATAQGVATSESAALSDMRSVTKAREYLTTLVGRATDYDTGITTLDYKPRSLLEMPDEVETWRYWFQNCPAIAQGACGAPNPGYTSIASLQAAVDAQLTSPGCNSIQWVNNSGSLWFNPVHPQYNVLLTNQNAGQTVIAGAFAQQEWEMTYELGATCQQNVRTIQLSTTRLIACESGFRPETQQWTNYVNCMNDEEGQVKFLSNSIPAEDCGPIVGNPCNVSNGEKTEQVVDYDGPGPRLVRTYRSNSQEPNRAQLHNTSSPYAWSHNYGMRLEWEGSRELIGLVRPDGSYVPVKEEPTGSGIYLPINGSGIQARAQETAGTVTGYTIYLPSGSKEIYEYDESSGYTQTNDFVLRELHSPEGLVTTVELWSTPGPFSGERPYPGKVTGPFGHELEFFYASNLQPSNKRWALDYVEDPAGRKIDYVYQSEYYGYGSRLKSVIYPDLTTEQYQYTKSGFPSALTGIVDENGTTYATFDYDSTGRVINSQHAGGFEEMDIVYNANGTVTVTDGEQDTFDYEFQDLTESPRQVAKISYADGDIEQLNETSGQRRITDRWITDGTNPLNHTHWTYLNDFQVGSITEGVSETRTTSFGYLNDTSNLTTFVETPSVKAGMKKRVTTTYYPGSQKPHVITELTWDPALNGGSGGIDTASPTRSYTLVWTDYNNLKEVDGPRPGAVDKNTFEYYEGTPGNPCVTGGECGQLKSMTNAEGHVTGYEYYADTGLLWKVTDPNLKVTSYSYDDRNRVTQIIDDFGGDDRTMTIDYDDVGQVDKVTFPNGGYLDYTWTAAHLIGFVKDNADNVISYTHDLRGVVKKVTYDVYGIAVQSIDLESDVHNGIVSEKRGGQGKSLTPRDIIGRLKSISDPRNALKLTSFEYDSLNRIEEIEDPLSGIQFISYDPNNAHDEPVSVQAPNGATTTFAYDDLGNLLEEDGPDREKTLYGYDEAGNMTCRADGRYTGSATDCMSASNRWIYTYDGLGRVLTIDTDNASSGAEIQYWYDTRPNSTAAGQKGWLRRVTYVQGSTTVHKRMDYDLFGNVVWQEQEILDGSTVTETFSSSFEYDGNDLVTKVTYPSGRVVDYQRYANGRIQSISSTFGGVTTNVLDTVSYYPFGPPLVVTYSNQTLQHRLLNADYSPSSFSVISTSGGGTLESLSYTPDLAGNITDIDDALLPAYSYNYEYDDLMRLIHDTAVSSTSPTYTYDANGNRLSRNATEPGFTGQTFIVSPPGSNRIDYPSGGNIYDGMGSLTATGGFTYTYDEWSRLKTAYQLAGAYTLTIDYNGLGEVARTVKTTPDPCEVEDRVLSRDYYNFLPHDSRALHIVAENATRVETDYVWLDGLPVAQFQDSYDSLGVLQGTTVTYLYTDHLGTPRLGADATGAESFRFRSDAFGKTIAATGEIVRLRMPGQVTYGLGDLNYNYFRDYNSETGRYLESDPIGLAGGINSYAYARQNPLYWFDPYGLTEDSPSNIAKRRAIAEWASAQDKSEAFQYSDSYSTGYSYDERFGLQYPASSWKCSGFTCAAASQAGAPLVVTVPVGAGDSIERCATAAELANGDISNWRFLRPDEKPKPGDIAAGAFPVQTPGVTGHTAVVIEGSDGTPTTIGAHADRVGPPGTDQFPVSPVYRRFIGD